MRLSFGAIILSLFCFTTPALADTLYSDLAGATYADATNAKFWNYIIPTQNGTTTIETATMYLKNESGSTIDVRLYIGTGFNTETLEYTGAEYCEFIGLASDYDDFLACDPANNIISTGDIVIGFEIQGSGLYNTKYSTGIYQNVYAYVGNYQVGVGGYSFSLTGTFEPEVIPPVIIPTNNTATNTMANIMSNVYPESIDFLVLIYQNLWPIILVLAIVVLIAGALYELLLIATK